MQAFNIISLISQNDRNRVSLVCIQETDTLAVLKERQNASFSVLQKIAALNSPFFPKVYEIERASDTLLILEEHLCGRTLRELLDSGVIFSESEFIFIATSIARALITLHSSAPAIILRDLKPENIMITDDNRVMIVDLDAAREYDSNLDIKLQDTVLLGTRSYAAPEQYGFTQTDIRSDIYSFGIVLSELLAATNCSKTFAKKAQKKLRKATMFAPEERYQNTEQMLSDINRLRNTRITKTLSISAICLFIAVMTVIAVSFYRQSHQNLQPTSAPTPPAVDITESWPPSQWVGDPIQGSVIDGHFLYKNAIIHVNELGKYCFWGFDDSFTPSAVTIPYVTEYFKIDVIDQYALAGRINLTEIIISEGISSIGDYAFQGSFNLKKIQIPDSVTEFGSDIFRLCDSVVIYCHKDSAAEKYAKENHITYSIME